MTILPAPFNRLDKRHLVAGGAIAAAAAALVLATEIPSSLLPAGGSTIALAELVARSPGARVGGVALKAKRPRAALSAAPASPRSGSGVPIASVLPAAAPEGAVPGIGAIGPAPFPVDFTAPAVPAAIGAVPSAVPGGFANGPSPGGGGLIIGPGGGGGGGGGATPGPNPIETPPVIPTPTPTGTTPAVVPAVPEPATWLMLILGFGTIGSALRRRERAAIA